MSVLTPDLRRQLERAVVTGRGVAESAAVAAVSRVGVGWRDAPGYLSSEERALRVGLRARARQLGDPLDRCTDSDVQVRCRLLIGEVAYEQWHRILFARFLEGNGLLRHPEFGVEVSLAECEELAAELGEPDGWSVAARFASEILPGIIKPSDPCAAVRLAGEDLLALERVLTALPAEVFTAEDSLGWAYQFWQSQAKAEVNASGRKIGGADLAPVTQLFTEDYMVRFLLENSLGAWWAARHPDSALLAEWEFLRRAEDGSPAAGPFNEWPERVAGMTVMDPCCGSGHFLVAAFGMLWRMRAEEEGLDPAEAQDAVLCDNLFGLELDARCTQITMFALALEAWKSGGFRALGVPNVACAGIPARAPLTEWTRLADGDPRLESVLTRLHALFVEADTLGSLIDPVLSAEQAGLESVDWHDVAPLLAKALTAEVRHSGDAAAEVFGDAAAGIARAADLLSRRYWLVATNVPYLSRGKQSESLRAYFEQRFPQSKADLAAVFVERSLALLEEDGAFASVSPQAWLTLGRYSDLRRELLGDCRWLLMVNLGSGAFSSIGGEVVKVALLILAASRPRQESQLVGLDVASEVDLRQKIHAMASETFARVSQGALRDSPDSAVLLFDRSRSVMLSSLAKGLGGITTGDSARYRRYFWELLSLGGRWIRQQSTVNATTDFGGRDLVLLWEEGDGSLVRAAKQGRATIAGREAWGKRGVAVQKMGDLPVTLYDGDLFENVAVVIVPHDEAHLSAIWEYCKSAGFSRDVRAIDQSIGVTCNTLVKVPFDLDHWSRVAEERYPEGLPEPSSDEPTQWLFLGEPAGSTQPLQVAIARLLGFAWPDQRPNPIDALVDADGIVCLPAIAGERSAAERVRSVLAASYGDSWSSSLLDDQVAAAGGSAGDLGGWLRDTFFKEHCRIFRSRPFLWHIWDGRRDGFSALVNYHRLDRANLEKLAYTTLGWWIDRQRADSESGVAGAEARLAAATELQRKLALILEGEPPLDIYVRWKTLAEQPMGWDPDLDDGVRLNIRPFVEAGVLRSKFTIQWKKDRGTNPDGSERHNDLHFTLDEKRAAREALS